MMAKPYDVQERAFARPVDRTEPARRLAVRSGGYVPLPPPDGAVDLFQGDTASLVGYERAQSGWAIRVGIAEATELPEGEEWDIRSLLAEIQYTTGGQTQVLTVDAAWPFSLHLVADKVTAKLRWGDPAAVQGPEGRLIPDVRVDWHLARGTCRTTATRSFFIAEGESMHTQVPAFATRWSLFSPGGSTDPQEALGTGDISLLYSVQYEGKDLHRYGGDDLLAILGGTTLAIPPGARHWSWENEATADFQLVFYLGDVGL